MGNLYFSFTNSSLFMPLTIGLVLLLVHFVTLNGGRLVPNAWQSFAEMIYDFVPNLVNEQISGASPVKQRFFPLIYVTFTSSLFCNPTGMIPYSFTVTSHSIITPGLSFPPSIGITIVGFQTHGLHFFSFSLPQGVPPPLAPFSVLPEPISYCFRASSLGIRSFANMMAGHSSVKILSGFARTMPSVGGLLYLAQLAPFLVVFALTGSELGVAIPQAHVSTISLCIYPNDAINLHQKGASLPSRVMHNQPEQKHWVCCWWRKTMRTRGRRP